MPFCMIQKNSESKIKCYNKISSTRFQKAKYYKQSKQTIIWLKMPCEDSEINKTKYEKISIKPTNSFTATSQSSSLNLAENNS